MSIDQNQIGDTLVISGSIISLFGIIANNYYLNHILAMQIWFLSNPILMTWSIGLMLKKWDGGLPALALVLTYGIAFVTGAYGLWMVPA